MDVAMFRFPEKLNWTHGIRFALDMEYILLTASNAIRREGVSHCRSLLDISTPQSYGVSFVGSAYFAVCLRSLGWFFFFGCPYEA